MKDWERDFEPCSSSCPAVPGTAFRGSQDWANTKAAYRFLDNDGVCEADILAGHFEATADRAAATTGRCWYCTTLQNSADLRDDIEVLGPTRINIAGVYRDGTPRYYTACGILMHSSLVVTPEGLPLGRP